MFDLVCFFLSLFLPPIETNLGEPPLRVRWNTVVVIEGVLPVLSGSLMMTVRSLQVAIKGRIQNSASRLYITVTECALKRPELITVHLTWQHFIGEKKKREVENLEYRKVFSFRLKENEAPAVCRADRDADVAPLVCATLSTLMNSLLLLTDPRGRHCPDRAHV